jgi:hypothetical protein
MIALPDYAKVKDNYCIAYFGHSKEYIVQLRLLRPIMETSFPGIKVYLSCKDQYMYLLKNEERIVSETDLLKNKKQYAYIREITCDMTKHPIEQFMLESDMPCGPIRDQDTHFDMLNGSCTLLTSCNPPTRSLNGFYIQKAIQFIRQKGCEPVLNKSIDAFDWIIGVENDALYEAAAMGKRVTLISTGLGENLFRSMFPRAQIIHL